MVIGFVEDYCKRQFEIKDDDGNVVKIKLGIELIDDIHLLEELIKYKKDGNFDRIISFGSALFYDHYLNVRRMFPKRRLDKTEIQESWESTKKNNRRKGGVFTNKRRKLL